MGERGRKEMVGRGKESMSEERKNLGNEKDKEMAERGRGWEGKGEGDGALQGSWVGVCVCDGVGRREGDVR